VATFMPQAFARDPAATPQGSASKSLTMSSAEEEASLPSGANAETEAPEAKRGRGRPAKGSGTKRSAPAAAGDDAGAGDDARKSIQKKLRLNLPIHKFAKGLKSLSHTKRVAGGTAVIMTSVIEYVTSEILELSGTTALENKKNRILPRHIQQAVRNDEELNKYLANVTIAGGGVIQSVHATALPKKDKPSTSAKAGRPASSSQGVLAGPGDTGSQVY